MDRAQAPKGTQAHLDVLWWYFIKILFQKTEIARCARGAGAAPAARELRPRRESRPRACAAPRLRHSFT